MEQWRRVIAYPYEVSTLGRVRRTLTSRGARGGHILAPRQRKLGYKKGYVSYKLCSGRRRGTVDAHRLVALTFLGPVPRGYEVDHINGNRTDNRLENLRYLLRRENRRQGRRHPNRTFLTAE